MEKYIDDYRGCWNCAFHDHADGFIQCEWGRKNATIRLRCPRWINENWELTEHDVVMEERQ